MRLNYHCWQLAPRLRSRDERRLHPREVDLDEAKDRLGAIQGAIVEEQARGALKAQVACPDCGTAPRHKHVHEIVVRSLFGTLRLPGYSQDTPETANSPRRAGRSGL
jgi:hypothetical protein